MELNAARQILSTLAQGIHPVTGEIMPESSPYHTATVLRALFAVEQALDGKAVEEIPNLQSARQIVDTLAQGIHPITGEVLAEDDPHNAPPLIRCLFAVSQALDAPPKPAKARREPPANAGKPWQPEEDAKLETAFAAGVSEKDIAGELGRTAWAVEARLVKLGRKPPRPGLRGAAPAAAAAT